MMHHYKRDREVTLERVNIDRERTHLNYTLGPDRGTDYIRERMEQVEATMTRSIRKDAITLCDWVVTVPPDVREEDYRKFFETTYDFVEKRYGADNMLGGWVHMDETTPHIHIAFTPVVEREDGRLAFSAKTMINKGDLDSFHNQLSRTLERSLGYSCQILLEQTRENALERSLSKVGSMKEYQLAKDGLERLRGRERELGERNRELEREAGGLRRTIEVRERELGKAQERERQIEETHKANEKEIDGLSAALGVERERARGLDGALERIRERVEVLRQKLGFTIEHIRGRFTEIKQELQLGIWHARERKLSLDSERVQECARAYRARKSLEEELARADIGTGSLVLEIGQAKNLRDRAEEELARARADLSGLEEKDRKLAAEQARYEAHPLRWRSQLAQVKEKRAELSERIREHGEEVSGKTASLEERQRELARLERVRDIRAEREREIPGLIEEQAEKARGILREINVRERTALEREMFGEVLEDIEGRLSRMPDREIAGMDEPVRERIVARSMEVAGCRAYELDLEELGLGEEAGRGRERELGEIFGRFREEAEKNIAIEREPDMDKKIGLIAGRILDLARDQEIEQALEHELARELDREEIERDLSKGRTEAYERAIGGLSIDDVVDKGLSNQVTLIIESLEEVERERNRERYMEREIERTAERICEISELDWARGEFSREFSSGYGRSFSLDEEKAEHDLRMGRTERYEKVLSELAERDLNRLQEREIGELRESLAEISEERAPIAERERMREIERQWERERSWGMDFSDRGLSL